MPSVELIGYRKFLVWHLLFGIIFVILEKKEDNVMISFIFWLAVLIYGIRLLFRPFEKDEHWTDYAWWLPERLRKEWKRKGK